MKTLCINMAISGFLLLLNCVICLGQKNDATYTYFNLPAPKDIPIVFASGIISTQHNEYNSTFSPDGNAFLYTIANNTFYNRFYTIFICRKVKEKWSSPEIASFSGQYSDADPFFTPDGKGVYFISTRPVTGKTVRTDFDIWYVGYQNGTFGEPQHLDNQINSSNDELYPSVSARGNLYFATKNENTGYDLMIARYEDGQFRKPVGVSDSINTDKTEFDAFVAPDESYIIYTSMGGKDNIGSGDLYISFRKGNYWTTGKSLGNKLNSVHMDQCPMVSPDGKFLFFTSFRDSQPYHFKKPVSTTAYLKILDSPLNGLGNIFWVDLHNIIDNL
ncbi:hypothetical protein QNI19_30290 [Cytophagaceae bacterium DM2B3-1]|uniref:WD40-like Beta Propeller Repeat n=1 Tax=Xanthocytophaga flava TaxID=3048013 RepID=A0ABT7CU49_9BACT|nr:hypothetical protein [Xanthocytophaga flavus]MDJ1472510.1 hypothetical protein [Xanthocytophaga flavus]MDJ1497267.1 hypothetical protein [Xanthocytophaga flavus]